MIRCIFTHIHNLRFSFLFDFRFSTLGFVNLSSQIDNHPEILREGNYHIHCTKLTNQAANAQLRCSRLKTKHVLLLLPPFAYAHPTLTTHTQDNKIENSLCNNPCYMLFLKLYHTSMHTHSFSFHFY